jgi:hypothetical protein
MAKCFVDGCKGPIYAKDLCEMHYWRQRRHGDPTHTERERGRLCSIVDCGRRHKAEGLCRLHLRRLRANGDPLKVQVLRTPGRHCMVEGCDNPHAAKGLCSIHYQRALRNPTNFEQPRIAPAGAPLAFIEEALKSKSDECLLWPYAHNGGYGFMRHPETGKKVRVQRFICDRAHGPAPTDNHQAAHSCGKGHMGCINPRHLRWATAKENGADKTLHQKRDQKRFHTAKLTEGQVRTIRSMKDHVRQRDVARHFSVTDDTIAAIWSGRTWAWLK